MKRLFSLTQSLAIALLITLMVFANHPFAAAAEVENFPGGQYSRALNDSSDYINDIRKSGQRYGKDSEVRGGYWTRRGHSDIGIDESKSGKSVIRQMRDRVDSVNEKSMETMDRAKNSVKRASDNVEKNVKGAIDDAGNDIQRTADRVNLNARRAVDNASDDNLIDRAQDKLEDISDNVVEKLNLDQPVPESTRRFLKDTQDKFEDIVEPITGKEKGFYQENIDRNMKTIGE